LLKSLRSSERKERDGSALLCSAGDESGSTVAYVFFYDDAILSWYRELYSFVTTCTNHSEYAALYLAAKEAQWMVYLFEELEPGTSPMPIYVDSSGVVSLVFNPVDHQSNKHIRIGCHYARELAEQKIIAPRTTWRACSRSLYLFLRSN